MIPCDEATTPPIVLRFSDAHRGDKVLLFGDDKCLLLERKAELCQDPKISDSIKNKMLSEYKKYPEFYLLLHALKPYSDRKNKTLFNIKKIDLDWMFTMVAVWVKSISHSVLTKDIFLYLFSCSGALNDYFFISNTAVHKFQDGGNEYGFVVKPVFVASQKRDVYYFEINQKTFDQKFNALKNLCRQLDTIKL